MIMIISVLYYVKLRAYIVILFNNNIGTFSFRFWAERSKHWLYNEWAKNV